MTSNSKQNRKKTTGHRKMKSQFDHARITREYNFKTPLKVMYNIFLLFCLLKAHCQVFWQLKVL